MSGCSGRMLATLILINILSDITKHGTLCQYSFSLLRARDSCLCPWPLLPLLGLGLLFASHQQPTCRWVCQFLMIFKHFHSSSLCLEYSPHHFCVHFANCYSAFKVQFQCSVLCEPTSQDWCEGWDLCNCLEHFTPSVKVSCYCYYCLSYCYKAFHGILSPWRQRLQHLLFEHVSHCMQALEGQSLCFCYSWYK